MRHSRSTSHTMPAATASIVVCLVNNATANARLASTTPERRTFDEHSPMTAASSALPFTRASGVVWNTYGEAGRSRRQDCPTCCPKARRAAE
jgi:hypothetical protein